MLVVVWWWGWRNRTRTCHYNPGRPAYKRRKPTITFRLVFKDDFLPQGWASLWNFASRLDIQFCLWICICCMISRWATRGSFQLRQCLWIHNFILVLVFKQNWIKVQSICKWTGWIQTKIRARWGRAAVSQSCIHFETDVSISQSGYHTSIWVHRAHIVP